MKTLTTLECDDLFVLFVSECGSWDGIEYALCTLDGDEAAELSAAIRSGKRPLPHDPHISEWLDDGLEPGMIFRETVIDL